MVRLAPGAFALIAGTAAGAERNWINDLATSGSFEPLPQQESDNQPMSMKVTQGSGSDEKKTGMSKARVRKSMQNDGAVYGECAMSVTALRSLEA
jgi:hypothetical protein